jgi:hypothetical protein
MVLTGEKLMSRAPLMPKATAVWLIDNTSMTFRQIADFCKLHELEVKGIADGDVAMGIKGLDPIAAGELTRDEIEKAQADSSHRLEMAKPKTEIPVTKPRKGPRYTPVSRRQDRPDAIAWLVRNHPELPDSAIMKLVGTTKPTINAIRDRSHWNSVNIKPVDPVALGLCTQLLLDQAVMKAAKKAGKQTANLGNEGGATLIPASETVAVPEAGDAEAPAALDPFSAEAPTPTPAPEAETQQYDADSVFGKSKESKPDQD